VTIFVGSGAGAALARARRELNIARTALVFIVVVVCRIVTDSRILTVFKMLTLCSDEDPH
jgi:hypothetical protein